MGIDKILGNKRDIQQMLARVGNKQDKSVKEINKFKFVQGRIYSDAIYLLRDIAEKGECLPQPVFLKQDSSTVVRPLSLREIIEARVIDYNTLKNPDGSERTKEDRMRLFDTELFSSTGFGYKLNSTKFKIIPVCNELIGIERYTTGTFLLTDYDKLDGFELDWNKDKYQENLTKAEVLEHHGWLAVVEEDKSLLKEYMEIPFAESKSDKLMIFWTIKSVITSEKDIFQDRLHISCVYRKQESERQDYYNFGVCGNCDLWQTTTFLVFTN